LSQFAAAIGGRYGNYQTLARTKADEPHIDPLMAMYWTFEARAVARRNLHLDRVRNSMSSRERRSQSNVSAPKSITRGVYVGFLCSYHK
jgi:hypothetical protein